MYDNLQHKHKVAIGKRVTNIQTAESGVEISTKDGETFTADIVVGADGVHSVIRREMRRIANEVDPKYFSGDEESSSYLTSQRPNRQSLICHSTEVPAKYKCLFGISKPVEGFPPASEHFIFHNGFSHFVVPGPQGRIYWFVFVNTGETLYGDKIPRYSKEDEALLVDQHSHDPITETTTFGDIYAARISSVLVPLQEHVYRRWHFQRIITIGDSVHKVKWSRQCEPREQTALTLIL